jgi:hypothetical protein
MPNRTSFFSGKLLAIIMILSYLTELKAQQHEFRVVGYFADMQQ